MTTTVAAQVAAAYQQMARSLIEDAKGALADNQPYRARKLQRRAEIALSAAEAEMREEQAIVTVPEWPRPGQDGSPANTLPVDDGLTVPSPVPPDRTKAATCTGHVLYLDPERGLTCRNCGPVR